MVTKAINLRSSKDTFGRVDAETIGGKDLENLF
jgi:hypothetical protein